MEQITAFIGTERLARGSRQDVARAIADHGPAARLLVFDDATGRQIDLQPDASAEGRAEAPAGRGRPKLGVVAREVTLLPRHWDWLGAQPGGASAALRRLVDAARQADSGATAARRARERAYAFVSAIAGDLPGFEEASRALFAGDREGFAAHMEGWPVDVREHALMLLERSLSTLQPG